MRSFKTLAISIYLLAAACITQGQTIAQWRGDQRDGVYQEKGLLKTWSELGPQLLWLNEVIGNGYGSPAVTGNQLFINGEIDSVSHVFAFDLNGKLLWKSPNGKEFMGKEYSANFPGSRSVPTVYNDLVYACSGMGRIACYDAVSGKERWAMEMLGTLEGKLGYFGYSESLFVDEKNVYCFPGGAESNIVALDKLTGKIVWTSKALGDGVSFCSPIVVKSAQRNILVTVSHEYLMGLDTRNGELLWSYKEDSVKREGEYCNTPVYSDGFIYGVSGVPKGRGAYKIALSADGKSVKEVWQNGKVLNKMGGFVKVKDQLFSTSADHKLKAIDTKNGMVVDSLQNLFGSVIYADDHLYCYADNGNMNLISLSDSKMEVISKFKVVNGTKEHFSHPVISNGVLYIRHGNALMAYQIK
ncbi:MAG TPA: PQQ-binding-like beta-propeller repeat protein [Prolixibacteraceae bacterium]|jgi:outer membrane protein assembly factor BamB